MAGNDHNTGALNHPLHTLRAGLTKALRLKHKDVSIKIRKGIYHLESTLQINSANYQLHSLIITAYAGENVTITGSKIISPDWKPYKNGILKARLVSDELPDQLYLNGENLPMARYPNFDVNARVYNGTAEDAISPERVKTWKNPAGGFIHALHEGEWGDFHFRITGKDTVGNLPL